MKGNRWIMPLVVAIVMCGSMMVKAENITIPDTTGQMPCTYYGGHYYILYDNNITHHDENYHYGIARCHYCGDTRVIGKEHTLETKTTKATPAKNGVKITSCFCGYVSNRTPIKWTYHGSDCLSYDINDFTDVYQDSKYIVVKLDNALKGAVLKVRIGNRTYRKKLKSKTKTILLKIKQHPIGSKIRIQLTYKGRIIGEDESNGFPNVYYSGNVKVGMTKKQVRWTWGVPKRKSRASGGWEFWYYEDGSSVTFHNGSVYSWYEY